MSGSSHWDDEDFATDTQAVRMHGTHPASKIILWTIFIFFTLGVLWAHYAEVDEVTRGEGRVIPSSQVQVVQNLEGGILKEIFIEEGQLVEAGQVLLLIDDTTFAANYGEKLAEKYSLIAKNSRLVAETEGKPLIFSMDLMAEAAAVARDEETLFIARREGLNSQLAILRQQADQRRQEVVELEGKLVQLVSGLNLAKEELDITQPLVAKGIVSKVNALRLKREVNGIEGEIKMVKLSLPRANAAHEESIGRIEEHQLEFRAQALGELNQSKAQLAALDQSMRAFKDRVFRTEVRSPVKGIVKQILIATVGGVIKPGMDLVEIVPIEDTLLVEAKIRPADIAFLRPKQRAVLKLSAYDFSIYGGLDAKIEHISADTIADEKGEAFYRIILRTEKNYLESKGERLPIIPGMVATADILTGHKTILEYILKPILKAREKALRER